MFCYVLWNEMTNKKIYKENKTPKAKNDRYIMKFNYCLNKMMKIKNKK